MVDTDSDLISQVRSLTDYDELIISASEMNTLLEIAKEELRSTLGAPDLSFYGDDTADADRALFWFLCIASKVKVGEIGGLNIDADDFAAQNPDRYDDTLWFRQYQKKRDLAEADIVSTGASSTTIERTDRSYEFDRPEGGL